MLAAEFYERSSALSRSARSSGGSSGVFPTAAIAMNPSISGNPSHSAAALHTPPTPQKNNAETAVQRPTIDVHASMDGVSRAPLSLYMHVHIQPRSLLHTEKCENFDKFVVPTKTRTK